jgi:hypothetical protein
VGVLAAAEAMEKEDEVAAGRKADSVLEKGRHLIRETKDLEKDRREDNGQPRSAPVALSIRFLVLKFLFIDADSRRVIDSGTSVAPAGALVLIVSQSQGLRPGLLSVVPSGLKRLVVKRVNLFE